ncbi:2,3-dihydro-2,3-dihydroxybenzoate dehydrogenase [Amycolatopsis pithecellobii]|uniref:2,3-dihydro-2,3-dihydroxybenzoate dehydrogenase n=1 Tax=Amycolatopsis pithecellobii TaxID=664692 RepID=A0A6N7Z7F2_9PSEU|nr:2,3-dihydro-2,3-dihydroxybenzoate dehydrogenase [Amycolatopsis pithecellobii]MTD55856.1 2,3-dihydro-2,3-dihydroxybenzoate dehydrogenase [Amycolatopsis pithecellobii]
MGTDLDNAGVALVTGAARGIGAAVSRVLAENGVVVAAVDMRAEELADTAGPHVHAYPADVAAADAADDLVARVERELGPVNTLVNVAGILRPGLVTDISDEDWTATFAVNTTAVFRLCRAVAGRMSARGKGNIVLIGSNAAGVPRRGMAAYAAAKAASTMFVRCLGLELAEHGVRCNIVSPGSTDTDMQRALWDEDGARRVIEGVPEEYRVGIPLGRLAEPVDIAEAVLFLVSDRARHITMHDLYVDGGATLRA